MSDLLTKIPEMNGVTKESVEKEIQYALKESMISNTYISNTFWNVMAPDFEIPPTEAVIAMMAVVTLTH